ncbi:MAG: hypothetical protein K0R98_894 [Rickettsiaceae bacterium]|jgi:hypothetical protein|nr:hypothetical protein [Rickettsiaceae bacterium]
MSKEINYTFSDNDYLQDLSIKVDDKVKVSVTFKHCTYPNDGEVRDEDFYEGFNEILVRNLQELLGSTATDVQADAKDSNVFYSATFNSNDKLSANEILSISVESLEEYGLINSNEKNALVNKFCKSNEIEKSVSFNETQFISNLKINLNENDLTIALKFKKSELKDAKAAQKEFGDKVIAEGFFDKIIDKFPDLTGDNISYNRENNTSTFKAKMTNPNFNEIAKTSIDSLYNSDTITRTQKIIAEKEFGLGKELGK